MVTTNQLSIIDTHTHKHTHTHTHTHTRKKEKRKKKKESKHNTKDSNQITREETKDKEISKNTYKNNPQTINKMAIRTYISIITLNVNGLNAPIKRHRMAEWIQKQDPYIYCLQETHVRSKDTHQLKVRRWSPSHQEACTSLLDSLIPQRADNRSKKNYNPAAWEPKPQSQKDR